MAKVIKKACVSVGEYTNREGVAKTKWLEVGRIMQGDKGSKFLLLDRSFNPSGIPYNPQYNTIMISLFDIEEDKDKESSSPSLPVQDKFQEDDIPF